MKIGVDPLSFIQQVPNPARFYDADYRPHLRSMVPLILAAEVTI